MDSLAAESGSGGFIITAVCGWVYVYDGLIVSLVSAPKLTMLHKDINTLVCLNRTSTRRPITPRIIIGECVF